MTSIRKLIASRTNLIIKKRFLLNRKCRFETQYDKQTNVVGDLISSVVSKDLLNVTGYSYNLSQGTRQIMCGRDDEFSGRTWIQNKPVPLFIIISKNFVVYFWYSSKL